MHRWISGVVLGVVVLVAVVSGCGGGDETSSTVTKAEFVKQADDICRERKKEWTTALASYQKEVKEKGVTGDPAAQREIAESTLDETMLPALDEQLQGLEDLGAPEANEKQVEKMLDDLSKAVKGIEKEGIAGVAQGGFADFEKEAKALGVTCPL